LRIAYGSCIFQFSFFLSSYFFFFFFVHVYIYSWYFAVSFKRTGPMLGFFFADTNIGQSGRGVRFALGGVTNFPYSFGSLFSFTCFFSSSFPSFFHRY
jgi:hypothetical protein